MHATEPAESHASAILQAVRQSPSPLQSFENIAANSAKTCSVLQQSGVESFEKATLDSSGGVHVNKPQLGESGPVADQVRSTLKEEKISSSLSEATLLRTDAKKNNVKKGACELLRIAVRIAVNCSSAAAN